MSGDAHASLLKMHEFVIEDYPTREDIQQVEQQFQVETAAMTATTTQRQNGYRFISHDQKRIIQARLDGFTFSWLAPYENWEVFSQEAKKIWEIYVQTIVKVQIIGIAVRYINRLDLPLPLEDFKNYLRTLPEISPDLPQGLSEYFMRLQMPQEDIGALLFINETIIPPKKDDFLSIVLDIELYSHTEIGQATADYWKVLDQLRIRKNEVFEACITDEMRALLR